MDLAKVSPGRSVKIREANTGNKNRDEGKLTPARFFRSRNCTNKNASSCVRTFDPNIFSPFQRNEVSNLDDYRGLTLMEPDSLSLEPHDLVLAQ